MQYFLRERASLIEVFGAPVNVSARIMAFLEAERRKIPYALLF